MAQWLVHKRIIASYGDWVSDPAISIDGLYKTFLFCAIANFYGWGYKYPQYQIISCVLEIQEVLDLYSTHIQVLYPTKWWIEDYGNLQQDLGLDYF
jgi:hypothetical protein